MSKCLSGFPYLVLSNYQLLKCEVAIPSQFQICSTCQAVLQTAVAESVSTINIQWNLSKPDTIGEFIQGCPFRGVPLYSHFEIHSLEVIMGCCMCCCKSAPTWSKMEGNKQGQRRAKVRSYHPSSLWPYPQLRLLKASGRQPFAQPDLRSCLLFLFEISLISWLDSV